MTSILENGEKTFCRNGLEYKPLFINGLRSKPLCRNFLDYAMESNKRG